MWQSAWDQVWADTKSKAERAIPDVGDDAFYSGSKLTFKKGSVYATLQVLGTNVDANTDAGANQVIAIRWLPAEP